MNSLHNFKKSQASAWLLMRFSHTPSAEEIVNKYEENFDYVISHDQAKLILEHITTNVNWMILTLNFELAGTFCRSFTSVEEITEFKKRESLENLWIVPLDSM